MQFSVFHPFPTYNDIPGFWPTPAKYARRHGVVTDGLDKAIEFARLADQLGYDAVSVAEHHYSKLQLSPNPLLAGAIIAPVLERADLNLLGLTLPLLNPIRAAEEIGMINALMHGRLLVGFFRGTPNELLTYGTNPYETREVFEEAVDLIMAAFSEPEPFGWLGRHFDYRTISVWPQFDEATRPKFLAAANSPKSLEVAARHRFIAGFSFAPQPVIAKFAAAFQETAAGFGWQPESDDMLYRCFALVAETDERAEEIQSSTGYGNMGNLFTPVNPEAAFAVAKGMAGIPADAPMPPGGPSMPGKPIFIGSPETVAAQVADFVRETGVGRIEITVNDAMLPYADAVNSLTLFGREVIPSVREQVAAVAV